MIIESNFHNINLVIITSRQSNLSSFLPSPILFLPHLFLPQHFNIPSLSLSMLPSLSLPEIELKGGGISSPYLVLVTTPRPPRTIMNKKCYVENYLKMEKVYK